MMSLDDATVPLLSSQGGQQSWLGLGGVMSVQTLHGVAYCTLTPHILSFGTTQLGLNRKQAAILSLAFSGVVFVLPIIGGALGDAAMSRYKAILTGISLYLIGTLILLCLTIAIELESVLDLRIKVAVFVAALVFVAVSRGFVIANIVPFGAEQVTRQTSKNLWSYFIWTFWFFNAGKLIAALPLPFIEDSISDSKRRLLPSVILQVVTIGTSAATFVLGKTKYTIGPPKGQETLRRIRKGLFSCVTCQLPSGRRPSSSSSMEKDRWYNAQLLRKLVLFTGLFATCGIYEAIIFQLTSTYIIQAGHLHHEPDLPDFFMTVFSPLVMVIFVPLLEVYNRNAFPCRSLGLHNLTVVAIGTFIATFSPLCAGIVETVMRKATWLNPEDSGISIFVQIPQYCIIGITDILVFVPGLMFVYSESPRFIQSSCTGLFFGLGSFVGFIIYVIQLEITKSVAEDSNNSTTTAFPYTDKGASFLEILFYALAGLVLFALVTTFIPLSILYKKAKESMPDKTDDEEVYRRGSITWASPQEEQAEDSLPSRLPPL